MINNHMAKFFIISFCLTITIYAEQINCSLQVGTKFERMICESPGTLVLDKRLDRYISVLNSKLSNEKLQKLKKTQQEWLIKRDNEINNNLRCDNACLYLMYKQRVTSLEQEYKRILNHFPKNTEVKELCNGLANKSINVEWISRQSEKEFDVNNDGENERITCSVTGTMGFEYCSFKNNKNEILVFKDEQTLWWSDEPYKYDPQYLRFKHKVYQYNDDYDIATSFLYYITPTNERHIVCRFKSEQIVQFIPQLDVNDSKEICAAVEKNDLSKITYFSWNQSVDKSVRTMEEFPKGGWATPVQQGKIDYDNDGIKNNLIEISYASTAGRGCSGNYFLELTPNYTEVDNNEVYKKFKDKQVGYADLFTLRYCDNSVKRNEQWISNKQFFRFKGLNYYELFTRNYHDVFLLKNDELYHVCSSKRKRVTKVE